MFNFDIEAGHIGGWLTKAEGAVLYRMASKVNTNQAIVEVGSWKGRSTICLARGSQDGNQNLVYAIDPHTGNQEHQRQFGIIDTFEIFKQNIDKSGMKRLVEPVRNASENVAKSFEHTIGLIFIDGAHDYASVRMDFNLWFPKLAMGGIIAFHDTWHIWGPNIFTAKLLLTSSKIKDPKLIDTITYFQKVERNSFFDRLKNSLFIIYRAVFGIKGAAKMFFINNWADKEYRQTVNF